MNTINITQLKKDCPLPELMHRLGLGQYAKSSCCSPFRNDSKPSWGIFQYGGRWMYKDHATGEVGDEIGILGHLYQLDPHDDFMKLLTHYQQISLQSQNGPELSFISKPPESNSKEKPDLSMFTAGTYAQIEQLSSLRRISIAGLLLANERGILIFGDWNGFEVYGVRDQSGRSGEIRRLDGQLFPAYGQLPAHKSHTLKHSQKDWPIGIMEASQYPAMALAEGLPDLLALHQYLVEEAAIDRVGAVGMLGASCAINQEALVYFKDKHVRIFPHADQAGIKAARIWDQQLKQAGVKKVDFFNFRAFEITAGNCIKDLCDFNQQRGLAGFNQQHILENII